MNETRKMQEKTPNLVTIHNINNESNLQLVRFYNDHGFHISDTEFVGPVFVNLFQTVEWRPPSDPRSVRVSHLLPYWGSSPPPLLIFGVGGAPDAPLYKLASKLSKLGVFLELMSTPAACRTWNVLMSEGREAAMCLYPSIGHKKDFKASDR